MYSSQNLCVCKCSFYTMFFWTVKIIYNFEDHGNAQNIFVFNSHAVSVRLSLEWNFTVFLRPDSVPWAMYQRELEELFSILSRTTIHSMKMAVRGRSFAKPILTISLGGTRLLPNINHYDRPTFNPIPNSPARSGSRNRISDDVSLIMLMLNRVFHSFYIMFPHISLTQHFASKFCTYICIRLFQEKRICWLVPWTWEGKRCKLGCNQNDWWMV